MKFRKITAAEYTQPIPDDNVTEIKHYTTQSVPNKIADLFHSTALFYIVTPITYFDNLIELLRGKNKTGTHYNYATNVQTNGDIVIAVRSEKV